jgi:hypothetical protein
MPDFYEGYQNGLHQEVYDELLAIQEQIYDPFSMTKPWQS